MEISNKTDNVAAVMKVFAVLEALAEGDSLNLNDLAQRALTSTSTAHRFLQTMKRLGYIHQNGDDKYTLTLKFFGLAASVAKNHADLVAVADPAMNQLSETTREAVNLGILDETGHSVVYIHKYDAHFSLGAQTFVGRRNPLYSTALGKVLLAWLDGNCAKKYLEAVEFIRFTPNTLANVDAVMSELETVRRQGYAEDNEEGEIGVHCLAAPIFNHLGKVVAAISVSFPVSRYIENNKSRYIKEMQISAANISGNIGFHRYNIIN
ncbi:DNA-binding transcriptional regulator KdgR [Consotaella aegiceratis]|uniref:DNA-binding transcriptional regulator KdgR n=1 Tax=Consotaella aegiceratis TaxID=3097961 RepID=UPI002F3E52B2